MFMWCFGAVWATPGQTTVRVLTEVLSPRPVREEDVIAGVMLDGLHKSGFWHVGFSHERDMLAEWPRDHPASVKCLMASLKFLASSGVLGFRVRPAAAICARSLSHKGPFSIENFGPL